MGQIKRGFRFGELAQRRVVVLPIQVGAVDYRSVKQTLELASNITHGLRCADNRAFPAAAHSVARHSQRAAVAGNARGVPKADKRSPSGFLFGPPNQTAIPLPV